MKFTSKKQFLKSKEWLLFREQIIIERGPVCEYCGETIVEPKAIQIDHNPIELTDENVNDVSISLNPENVKVACIRCHNRRHNRFCGPAASKKKKAVYIVYGPPMSGKTSFVVENMQPGDLVVDIDRLSQAISLQQLYDKPEGLKYIVFGLRNLLIDNIKTRYGSWNSAWIIGGYADKYLREKLATDLGAELIYIEADKEDCLYRLSYCNDYRQQHQKEWTEYINKWFENYTE